MSESFVVVVDPYFSHLVARLKADGRKLIAVFSDYALAGAASGIYSVDAGQFEAVYHVDSDTSLDGVVKELAQRPISTVVNGFDTGCSLWVKLCNALGFPHRPAAELSHVLGNKYRTGNHIRGKGIVVAQSVLVTSANASHCIEQIESCIEYPLVIKPTESAGSFGVHVCHDRREAETAIATLLDKADVYGNVVSEVVAEELLRGPEYSVCTITSQGQHVVSAVFTYEEYMIEGVKFARSVELVAPESAPAAAAIEYATAILDAIGYEQGQAYVELILTDKGPRLVELNPRVAGLNGVLDVISELCTGQSQVGWTSASCAGVPMPTAANDRLYRKQGHGKLLFLRAHEATTVRHLEAIARIEALPSVRTIRVKVRPGDAVPITTDVLSSPGHIVMCHDDPNQLQRDIDNIDRMEREGLFG